MSEIRDNNIISRLDIRGEEHLGKNRKCVLDLLEKNKNNNYSKIQSYVNDVITTSILLFNVML